jgi:hypothetical protein
MNHQRIVSWSLVGVLLLSSTLVFAAGPVRKTSANGSDDNAFAWNLFGPTFGVPTDGGDFSIATQVICPDRSVGTFVELDKIINNSSDPSNSAAAGSCVPDPNITDSTTSRYLFLFQVQTNKKNFKATISNLVGFVPVESPDPNYGIEICDTDNTLQLCTFLSQPDAENLNVTTTVSANNKKITHVVRKLPFIAGELQQGQGLTFFVLTEQPINAPIVFPKFNVQ